MLDPERPKVRLLGGACRGEHLQARCPRQLYRRQPHAAGGGVDEDTVTGLEPGHLKAQAGTYEGRGYGRKCGGRYSLRRRRNQFRLRDDLGSECAEAQSDYTVAHREFRDVRGRLHYSSAEFLAQLWLCGIQDSHAEQDVEEVQTYRVHCHSNLARFQGLIGCRLCVHSFQFSLVIGHETPGRSFRKVQSLPRCAASDEASGQAVAIPVSDLGLLIRMHQLIDQAGDLRRIGGVKVQHSRAKVSCLSRHHPSEAPQGCPGQLSCALAHVVALKGLRPKRDEPQAPVWSNIRIQQGLHQGQSATPGTLCVLLHLVRGGIRPVPVECTQVQHTLKLDVFGKFLKERLP